MEKWIPRVIVAVLLTNSILALVLGFDNYFAFWEVWCDWRSEAQAIDITYFPTMGEWLQVFTSAIFSFMLFWVAFKSYKTQKISADIQNRAVDIQDKALKMQQKSMEFQKQIDLMEHNNLVMRKVFDIQNEIDELQECIDHITRISIKISNSVGSENLDKAHEYNCKIEEARIILKSKKFNWLNDTKKDFVDTFNVMNSKFNKAIKTNDKQEIIDVENKYSNIMFDRISKCYHIKNEERSKMK